VLGLCWGQPRKRGGPWSEVSHGWPCWVQGPFCESTGMRECETVCAALRGRAEEGSEGEGEGGGLGNDRETPGGPRARRRKRASRRPSPRRKNPPARTGGPPGCSRCHRRRLQPRRAQLRGKREAPEGRRVWRRGEDEGASAWSCTSRRATPPPPPPPPAASEGLRRSR